MKLPCDRAYMSMPRDDKCGWDYPSSVHLGRTCYSSDVHIVAAVKVSFIQEQGDK